MTENEAIQTVTAYVYMECENMLQQVIKALNIMKDATKEIQPYRAIGTVEECRAAVEKQIPYKPEVYEGRYYACKCDNILLPKWEEYPTKLMPKSNGLPYCLACGQKLDWGE